MRYPWRDFNHLLDKNLFKYLRQLLSSLKEMNSKQLEKIVIVVEKDFFCKSCENLMEVFGEEE